MNRKRAASSAMIFLSVSTAALAGDWMVGYADAQKEAREDALNQAMIVLNSKPGSCITNVAVEPTKIKATHGIVNDQYVASGKSVAGVYVSYTNGSCRRSGISADDVKQWANLARDLNGAQ